MNSLFVNIQLCTGTKKLAAAHLKSPARDDGGGETGLQDELPALPGTPKPVGLGTRSLVEQQQQQQFLLGAKLLSLLRWAAATATALGLLQIG